MSKHGMMRARTACMHPCVVLWLRRCHQEPCSEALHSVPAKPTAALLASPLLSAVADQQQPWRTSQQLQRSTNATSPQQTRYAAAQALRRAPQCDIN